ncbi:MAG: hypothetical protein F9B45_28050 [Phycisphaera sp. RhM]|nr:hypothetical protein [Phycisphaera sp. RhM]
MSQTTTRSAPSGVRRKQGNVFHQRLGSLTFSQACQLLGDEGATLIRQGAQFLELHHDDVFLGGELIPSAGDKAPSDETVATLTERLSECVDKDEQGRPQLTITLPDTDALRGLATTLAKLLDS